MFKMKSTINYLKKASTHKNLNLSMKNKVQQSIKMNYNSISQIKREIRNEGNYKIAPILHSETYTKRHIGPIDEETTKFMLKSIGFDSLESLVEAILPKQIKLPENVSAQQEEILGNSLSEKTALEYISLIADKNKVNQNYIGLGYHPNITPPVILRNVLENPGWYTSYSPYQAEISQGRMELLVHYQNLICELTGLPWANASLLDEATAAAEAMYLSLNAHYGRRTEFFITNDIFPYVKEVIKTRANLIGVNLVEGSVEDLKNYDLEKLCGAIIQNPSNTGKVSDHTELVKTLAEKKVVSVMNSDPLSLMIYKSAGEMGFDICIGSAQRLGIPMMNGGPHAGFMAVKDEHKRKLPGRIIAISKDVDGEMAFRLSLQTREQHIKREKATSNICTAQALLANMSALYAIFHGKDGLDKIAARVNSFAVLFERHIKQLGFKTLHEENEIFDTVVIDCKASGMSSKDLVEYLEKQGINARDYNNNKFVGFSFNETNTATDIEVLLKHLQDYSHKKLNKICFGEASHYNVHSNKNLLRNRDFLNQDIYNKLSSETKFMRFLYVLQKKDYSLIDGMIPLGSCTMKLNAASTLIPITNPKFANIHPFSPKGQLEGYKLLIEELVEMLKTITQFDCVSLQPNSGANGEFSGILAIRRYHKSIGQEHRNICLIPASAHGTNPASAAIAGLKVVVVKSTKEGNIDIEDLKAKAEQHKDNLACVMITYPSTHGVYEENIIEYCDIVHKAGGQVYIDGANMNAQVMLTSPRTIGGDVCHLNLHKTFAIPHGGGGPGVGPICARKHLEQFLPGHYEFDSK